ncbi:Fic family protein [Geothrix sp. PMB-07]|uniref:Fic family protein n=1 Tax=Geothrix sp. PMB-07 TaxID=3068640 RepID=UPI0027407088|nr:Fic family protein [Geothrix sp. PMB-07]WLT32758.1 Fic family protein [Geothrix sp. PMB-07]
MSKLVVSPEIFFFPKIETIIDPDFAMDGLLKQKFTILDELIKKLEFNNYLSDYFIQEDLFSARYKIVARMELGSDIKNYLKNRAILIRYCFELVCSKEYEQEKITLTQLIILHKNLKRISASNLKSEFRKNKGFIGTSNKDIYIETLGPEHIESYLEKLFDLINNEKIPKISRIAIFYMGFLTIHPFEDGNGRVARIYASLLFYQLGIISLPVFNLSATLEKHQFNFMTASHAALLKNDWNIFFQFFYSIVYECLEQHIRVAKDLLDLETSMTLTFKNNNFSTFVIKKIIRALYLAPISSRSELRRYSGLSLVDFQKCISVLLSENKVQLENNNIVFSALGKIVWNKDWEAAVAEDNKQEVPSGLIPINFDAN